MKYQSFTVEGAGRFPIDMLRYDCCYPATGTDAGLIESPPLGERYRVGLERKVAVKSDLPTAGRWNSFGWNVLETSTR